jgi:hypothetical protein
MRSKYRIPESDLTSSYAEKKSVDLCGLFIFPLLLIFSFFPLQAQQNMLLYHLQNIPQSNFLNPGQIPLVKKYIGLPILSGVRGGAGTNELMYDDFRSWLGDAQEETDYFGLNNRISDGIGRIVLDAEVHLLSLGTRIGKGFASLDIGQVVYASGRFSKSIFTLLSDLQEQPYTGGAPLMYDFTNLDLNGAHYRSFSLGYAHQLSSNLSVGGRFRWLQGAQGIWTDKNDLRFRNQTDGSLLEVMGQLNILTSGLSGQEDSDFFSHLQTGGNSGFAVDLGGVYQLNDEWEFAVSALNIGQISWKKQVDYAVIGDHISFTNEDPDTFVEQWKTAIEDQLDGMPANPEVRFTTPLPQRFIFASRYFLNPKTSLGLLANTVFFNRSTDIAVSLSANTRMGKILGASVAATYNSYSTFNLGLGFSVDLGPVQVYALADNLPAVFNWKNAGSVQAQLGINLIFGRLSRSDLLPEPELPIAAVGTDSSLTDSLPTQDSLQQQEVVLLDDAATDPPEVVQMEEEVRLSPTDSIPDPALETEDIFAVEEEPPVTSSPPLDSMPLREEIEEIMVPDAVEEETEAVDLISTPVPEVSPPSPAVDAEQGAWYTIAADTNLHEGPVYTSDVLERLQNGDRVEVVKKTGRWWWKVRFGGTVGFVKTEFLEELQGNRE